MVYRCRKVYIVSFNFMRTAWWRLPCNSSYDSLGNFFHSQLTLVDSTIRHMNLSNETKIEFIYCWLTHVICVERHFRKIEDLLKVDCWKYIVQYHRHTCALPMRGYVSPHCKCDCSCMWPTYLPSCIDKCHSFNEKSLIFWKGLISEKY